MLQLNHNLAGRRNDPPCCVIRGIILATGLGLQHFAAAIGLPFAALAALGLVTLFETRSGPIEFEALGLKFKGASGPIIFWVLSFLAIAVAIKLLW